MEEWRSGRVKEERGAKRPKKTKKIKPRERVSVRFGGNRVKEWRNGRVKEQRGEFKKIYNNICS